MPFAFSCREFTGVDCDRTFKTVIVNLTQYSTHAYVGGIAIHYEGSVIVWVALHDVVGQGVADSLKGFLACWSPFPVFLLLGELVQRGCYRGKVPNEPTVVRTEAYEGPNLLHVRRTWIVADLIDFGRVRMDAFVGHDIA